LRGTLEPHHAFMISQHLALLDVFDEQIAAFDERSCTAIEATRTTDTPDGGATVGDSAAAAPSAPNGAWMAQAILDAIPGIGMRVAETILAELGADMSRFPE
jgi:transposase